MYLQSAAQRVAVEAKRSALNLIEFPKTLNNSRAELSFAKNIDKAGRECSLYRPNLRSCSSMSTLPVLHLAPYFRYFYFSINCLRANVKVNLNEASPNRWNDIIYVSPFGSLAISELGKFCWLSEFCLLSDTIRLEMLLGNFEIVVDALDSWHISSGRVRFPTN